MKEPPVCIGCGRDHAPGGGCGYERAVTWTPYTTAERLRHLRIFPVVVGAAAAAGLVHLILNPAGDGLAYTGGLVILGFVAFFFGVLGLVDVTRELRKRRWRAASNDGRDRALVVMLGGKVDYGFGESLRYEPMDDVAWASALGSREAIALLPTLRGALRESWKDYVRTDMADRDLFPDEGAPGEDWSLIVFAAMLGLGGRGEATLLQGRYVGWGRGRAKMKDLTEGLELAFQAQTDPTEEMAPMERALLALSAPGPESPSRLDDVLKGLLERGLGPDGAFGDVESIESVQAGVEEAWSTLLDKEPELLTLAVEHAIGVLKSGPASSE